jgi:hypothetical protein
VYEQQNIYPDIGKNPVELLEKCKKTIDPAHYFVKFINNRRLLL